MRPAQCYSRFIYVYSVFSFQICSVCLLVIAGWLYGAYGNSYVWKLSLIIIAVVLTVIGLVVGFLAL